MEMPRSVAACWIGLTRGAAEAIRSSSVRQQIFANGLRAETNCDNIGGLIQTNNERGFDGTPNNELVQPAPANGNAAGRVWLQRTDAFDVADSSRGLS